jgi:thiamine biosynthesis protein ThiS
MVTVAGKSYPWWEGMTITDLLGKVNDSYPYAVVRVNSTYVSRANFDKTTIPDNSEVFFIPMIAGG